MYKASPIFTNINELPFNNEEERTKLRVFFAYNDATKVEAILSTITGDEAKVKFLRGYVDKSRVRMKLKIDDAFPDGLPYKKPNPLLYSSGIEWDYQQGKTLYQELQDAIMLHYKNFKNKKIDKCNIPFYFFVSGPGAGKSRNSTELHRMAVECTKDLLEPIELKNWLSNSWTFNTSFENGFSLRPSEIDPFLAVGSRMLCQLLNKKLDSIIEKYDPPHPLKVLEMVSKYENRKLDDVAIILVVDGIHNVMSDMKNDGVNKESLFYKTLSSIGDLSLEETFLIACCTASTTSPVEQFLATSSRFRVFLPITSLRPPTITGPDGIKQCVFDMNNSVIKLLVGDCGGHGRSLEILYDSLTKKNINDCNVNDFMSTLQRELKSRYISAFSYDSKEAKQIIRAIITHTILDLNKPIPGTNLTPDAVTTTGMFRFERKQDFNYGYLSMPYLWLWIMAEKFADRNSPDLKHWNFNDYEDQLLRDNNVLVSGYAVWQNFEKFNAGFRCLKSKFLDEGEMITISTIHHGARLCGDIKFKNHHLQLDESSHQVDTSSTNSKDLIACEHENVDLRTCTNCILNASGAPYGDMYLRLDMPNYMKNVHEVHQYKKLDKTPLTQDDYNEERKKASSVDDYFMLITTKDCSNITIPNNCGIVDKNNWNDYFGLFSGRAYMYSEDVPDLNTASRTHLQIIDQIGETRANMIIEERNKRKFRNLSDAEERLPSIKKQLIHFKVSS
ncbi:unnamed protein product [Rhizophagus irregularis]|uniref:Crinkler family protein n=1 Tax=Rhizophagus irregularis TaxID=588596 RepID=A0A915ZKY3_9GLOM|nr:unnamed protein product [Rhizophagus irregularis]